MTALERLGKLMLRVHPRQWRIDEFDFMYVVVDGSGNEIARYFKRDEAQKIIDLAEEAAKERP